MKFPVLLLAASIVVLAGCEEPGPAERLGQNIDDGIESARESVEETAETVGDELERARRELEEANN